MDVNNNNKLRFCSLKKAEDMCAHICNNISTKVLAV
jgi:hypothetical protein